MRFYWVSLVCLGGLAACTAPPDVPEEVGTVQATSETDDSSLPLKVTPLEDVIADGDYNNDRPPETQVPGTGNVQREVPKDPFLERVEKRGEDTPQ